MGSVRIALVGMACRYPDARTPGELWENVLAGRRAFRHMPRERLRLADYLADRADPDGLYSTQAAVLEGWEFDRVRFKVAGATFRTADLAHWLALEVAAQALADAGLPEGAGVPRDTTGVLLGNSLTGEFSRANLMRYRWPYVRRTVAATLAARGYGSDAVADLLAELEAAYKAPFPEPTEESLAGGLANTIAGRICNHFDLHGGGYTVDGACASSLLAVAQACTALAAGDLDMALAGGVDLSLDPFELVGFARTGALTDSEMRVFDARSAGFIPGEGCGVVVLEREEDALAAGRRIYAVLRGWGISSDGHGGISRPEPAGQLLALGRAYRKAGLSPAEVGYFEGHGTGTAVGDAAELATLKAARREAGATAAAPVGSIKANIGHTKAAAGVAALIKAVMAVHTQILPPNTGCEERHPEIADGTLLTTLEKGEPWPAGRPLYAAASAMGFGGINTHVVIEGTATSRRRSLAAHERALLASAQDAEVLLLAAAGREELAEMAARLAGRAESLSHAQVGDLAAELARRLPQGTARARAAVVTASPAELARQLATLAERLGEGRESDLDPRQGIFFSCAGTRPRIGLLFPGQGAPSHLSGGAVRRRFTALEDLYASAPLPPDADPTDTAVAQPAILTHSVAGLWLLERLGIRAAVGLGHSLGEITALCWAGALAEEEARRLAAVRGRIMAEPDPGVAGRGAMASLAASPEEAAELLGEAAGAGIAAFNGPRRTVISGDAEAVEAAARRAEERGIVVHRLRVSHAFHSPRVAAAAPRLARELAGLAWRPPARPVASTVTGALLSPDADPVDLLVRQVTAPVRFADALNAARGMADLWLEVGPGRALSELAGEMLEVPVLALDVGGPSLSGLLKAAGAAFALGVPVATEELFEGRFTRALDLERPGRFLENPCELAPEIGEAARPARTERTDTDGAAPAAGASAAGMPAAPSSPLELVRLLVAERAELPLAAVDGESRLLSDLHLNSISVGQLVAEAARRLGLRPPAQLTDYARSTVAEVAAVLAEQQRSGSLAGEPAANELHPAGIGPWVRAFATRFTDRPLPRAPRADGAAEAAGEWQVVAPPGLAGAAELGEALVRLAGGRGVALCLPAEMDEALLPLLLDAAGRVLAAPRPVRFLLVQAGGVGGGFARTLHLEHPDVATALVHLDGDLPLAAAGEAVAAEARLASEGFSEVRLGAGGRRRVPGLVAVEETGDRGALPLGPGDVLLVSGGGKGIGAECALELARRSGARLALLGRAAPGTDAELDANLARLRAAGAEPCYVAADVTDAASVAVAVAAVEAELGPVTAVLHAAGRNVPRLLSALALEDYRATLAPKVGGLANLLAALDPARLRLLVSFGSIIGRMGLAGQADYALANEWLGEATRRFGGAHPGCRCLTLDWSVWSGVGMGERLASVDKLAQAGISAISIDAGVDALCRLLSHPAAGAEGPLVIAGRFGEPPTLPLARPELPLWRFLERPRVFVPGVELVVDCALSADTDPHLSDHVFRGEPLFAAVLGLEAMAQAALALTGRRDLPAFEDVELSRPVAVPPGQSTAVRIAALVRDAQRVDVALRDASTGFAADHFRATCRFGPPPESTDAPLARGLTGRGRLPVETGDLYGSILFHRGRFVRLNGYRHLSATECLADISPDGAVAWFGRYLPAELVLGDPGARDAAIHGIQACIPHATLLPVAVERITAGFLDQRRPLALAARERFRDGDTFVYDLEVSREDGTVVERWEGLTLRAVDRTAPPAAWAAPLFASYAERRLQEILPGAGLRIELGEGDGNGAARASDPVALRLLGAGASFTRRPDGKPETGGPEQVSISHAGGMVLAVTRRGEVGCDLEPVVARPAEVWRDLLGSERFALAELAAREGGEDLDSAATRVWSVAESLKKAGAGSAAPIVLKSAIADGWMLFGSGNARIGSFLAPLRELAGKTAFAVVAGES